MQKLLKITACMSVLASGVFFTGCTTTDTAQSGNPTANRRGTTIREPTEAPQPAKIRFSEFQAIEMKHVKIDPAFASADANQRAAKKIDENLFALMRGVFPNLCEEGTTANQAGTGHRTLLIEPQIEAIKFIGGAARFWVGAMAGNSAVLMKVIFKDKATGEVIAAPEFFNRANAWEGGQSVGGSDNAMLSQIAQQVANYTSHNK